MIMKLLRRHAGVGGNNFMINAVGVGVGGFGGSGDVVVGVRG
ncbi:Protein of unknown function [Micromonospora lupini str. Lupac 08]|uniref:Uncharacterized protein n=1 Tax=Micromonospora lupini str. Lupac 08 TaxID=1150864 RepID=I0LDT9_9ACTN|nr:Protein of unknown function [Micromonospora lupini str. Lupac 08]